ncbi:TetR/AcrR family transcriptional regulator [Thermasporomyces composti]|jgi:AcrR family transcriptional regulator|uniref:TetR family transcriptional regulator n=1 Tax=Thermasporomyces composti TaxID=696763 RepID=A0A3D9V8U8_THECX|nr:TetR/AcrR family transcriptional regulator [Thermasporomyces composti]REF36590.1 TetR family transcriptional regulator [Thermasporomyces composti]
MRDKGGPQSGYSQDVELLSIGTEPRKERADAARNRARILAAAARLFAVHGVAAVSMDQIAAEAGVGKGTLFRRFGDKAGLAVALLDQRERDLQDAILSGPPPLGPGAPPLERLVAFLRAYAEFLDENLELIHLSETASPGARYRIGAYRLWHRHVALQIAAARDDLDAEYLAHVLLAPLAADQRKALREEFTLSRVQDGLAGAARAIVEQPTTGRRRPSSSRRQRSSSRGRQGRSSTRRGGS